MEEMPMSIASYNVLASAYVRRTFYPRSPSSALDQRTRLAAIAETVAALDTDVICLQETEPEAHRVIQERLIPLGYRFIFAQRDGRPDGCGTFVRALRILEEDTLRYHDGSGHLALLLVLDLEGRRLGVANTHIKWDAPDAPFEERVSHRQVGELLERCARRACDGWLLCGDLNAHPDSDLLCRLESAGFRDALPAEYPTCVTNGHAHKIDYLLHTASLLGTAAAVPTVDNATIMPSVVHASDHVPVQGHFRWR